MMKQFELKPYQQALFDKISAGGFRAGELVLFSARASGKSMLNSMYGKLMEQSEPKFRIVDQAPVDGATWYTVSCRKDVSMWVREHGIENKEWYEHIDCKWMVHKNVFDMHEELYSMLALRWS